MKKKKKIELNVIYNETCLETLKRMEDQTVDCVITSPPYNMNLRIEMVNIVQGKLLKLSTKYDDC